MLGSQCEGREFDPPPLHHNFFHLIKKLPTLKQLAFDASLLLFFGVTRM